MSARKLSARVGITVTILGRMTNAAGVERHFEGIDGSLELEIKRRSNSMNFGQALELAKTGQKICRAGWNGRGMWIELQVPDDHSKMTKPYLYMKAVDGGLFPWNPNQLDMLSEDWQIAQ